MDRWITIVGLGGFHDPCPDDAGDDADGDGACIADGDCDDSDDRVYPVMFEELQRLFSIGDGRCLATTAKGPELR